MTHARVVLDRGLSALESLGVGADELFDPAGFADGRAEVLSREGSETKLRFPLPGTPDASGRLTARPAGTDGAGTGWVWLNRWLHAPIGRLMRTRFTHPRSASLAERQWNLICHLRGHGVGTPQPLAVGARGAGLFSRDSFLVTREPRGYLTLPQWMADKRTPRERRKGLVSLGNALAKLFDAGVLLPRLRAEHVLVRQDVDLGTPECADDGPGPGLKRNKLPSVLVTDFTDGVIRSALGERERDEMLRGLADEVKGSLGSVALARILVAARKSKAN